MKLIIALAFVLLAGCGSKTPAPKTPDPEGEPEAGKAVAPGWTKAGILRGDWRIDADSTPTSWLRPGELGNAIYGVDLQPTPTVIVIDDEPTDKPPAQRTMRMWFYDGGKRGACEEHLGPGEALAFTCPGDATFRFWKNGPALDVEAGRASNTSIMHLLPAEDLAAAPELEEADRQFSRDTTATGAKGWVAWFADDGEQWRGDTPVIGHEAIEAMMTKTFEVIDLVWEPTVSRLAPDGKSGYTAGTYLLTMLDGSGTETGTYVTGWVKTAAGWKIRFDIGRPDL